MMENLVVRNMYNGNLMMVPKDDPEPNKWFKLIVILLISFLIIKILINNL
jgi:hypothetical protein